MFLPRDRRPGTSSWSRSQRHRPLKTVYCGQRMGNLFHELIEREENRLTNQRLNERTVADRENGGHDDKERADMPIKSSPMGFA